MLAHSRWKHVLNHYKDKQWVYFSIYKILGYWIGTRQKSACGKSFSCRLSLSAARNAITKAIDNVTFGFSFRILVFFPFYESLNITVSKRYGFFSVFSSHNPKTSDRRPWIENGKGFDVHSSTWPSGVKGEWRVNSWLVISNMREKILCFVTRFVAAFLRAGNPSIAPKFIR